MDRFNRLPEHMRGAAKLWVERGFPHPDTMGGFLRSVLENDFAATVCNADRTNREELDTWGMWLWNDCPQGAWGSRERLIAWHEAGGLNGPRLKHPENAETNGEDGACAAHFEAADRSTQDLPQQKESRNR